MKKKGVSQISGIVKPTVGEAVTYTVTGWYPSTSQNERNPANVIWELFKKRSNGRFTSTNIKKTGSGTFTFGEVAQKHTYRLEAYLFEPEGSGPSTLDINPQPAAVPKISKVELQYVDDSPGAVFSFTEKMRACAQCVNLNGKKLKFTLWEDDAAGKGHNAKNLLIETKEAIVDKAGVAIAEFMLTKALMKKATEGEFDVKKLEFYVTVEYYASKHTTENVNVNNPFPPIKGEIREDKSKTVTKAKDSPAASKPASKKEEKGILDNVKDWWKDFDLWDWGESRGTVKKEQKPTIEKPEGKSVSIVKEPKSEKREDRKKDGKCSCNNNLSKDELKSIAIHASQTNIDKYFDGFNETFEKFNINSCLQKIHFLAQVIHESGSFRYNVEQGNASYLAKYGGWHGRGLIQLTTKSNYEAFEKAIGEDVTSSSTARDKVTKSPYAVYSAGWFWDERAVLNGYANKNDFIYITYRVNGGFNHVDDRLLNVKKGFEILYSKCVNDNGKNTDYKFKDSKAYDDKKASFAWGLWHDSQFNKVGCKKDKNLAMEGYQRFVDLTAESDVTTNYYSIQGLNYFSNLVYTKTVKGKTKKYVNVRKAALKRLNDLKNE